MDFEPNDFEKNSNPEDQGSPPTNRTLPPGAYVVWVSDEITKPTKSGNGEYLQLTLTITEGEYSGMRLYDRLNLRNPSQKAVNIARKTLQRICEAAGTNPHNSRDLVGCRLKVLTFNEVYQGKIYPKVRDYNEAPAQNLPVENFGAGEDLPF